jgi:dual specificity protein kinase YAK1
MDQQWAAYEDSPSNRQPRYAPQSVPSQQSTNRDMTLPTTRQDTFSSPAIPQRAPSSATLPPLTGSGQYNGDGDGDVRMEDVDAYNKPKQQAPRVGHSRNPSAHLLQQEESAAARRYSPMNLSSSSPYGATPQSGQGQYNSYTPQMPSNRQSPVRSNSFVSSLQGYGSPPGMSTHTRKY